MTVVLSRAQQQEFDAWLVKIANLKAKQLFQSFKYNSNWAFEDFLSEAYFVAVKNAEKTKEIYFNPDRGAVEANRYISTCIKLRVNDWAFEEAVRKAHHKYTYASGDDFEIDRSETIKGYADVLYNLKNKTPWALDAVKKYLSPKKQIIMITVFFDGLKAREVSEVLAREGYSKITPSSITEAKDRCIKEIILGQISDLYRGDK